MCFNIRKFLTAVLVSCFAVPVLATAAYKEATHELGVSVSSYKYQELVSGYSNFMSIKATNIGLDYIGTLSLDSCWFFRGGLEAVFKVSSKYTSDGSGYMDNPPNWYIDGRGVFGKELNFSRNTLSPYAGLGIRYLRNDMDGMVSSVGHLGYLRESTYFYLPFGLDYNI